MCHKEPRCAWIEPKCIDKHSHSTPHPSVIFDPTQHPTPEPISQTTEFPTYQPTEVPTREPTQNKIPKKLECGSSIHNIASSQPILFEFDVIFDVLSIEINACNSNYDTTLKLFDTPHSKIPIIADDDGCDNEYSSSLITIHNGFSAGKYWLELGSNSIESEDAEYEINIVCNRFSDAQCEDNCDAFSVKVVDYGHLSEYNTKNIYYYDDYMRRLQADDDDTNTVCYTYKIERLLKDGICADNVNEIVLGACNDDKSLTAQNWDDLVVRKYGGDIYKGFVDSNINGIRLDVDVQDDPIEFTLCLNDANDNGETSDFVQCFAEENYGEGKTLKQWMENALKGSFKTSLLEIAGAIEHSDNAYNEYSDFASYTDSEQETSLYLPRKVTMSNAKSVPAPTTPKSESKNYAMIVSSPEEVEEEIERQHSGQDEIDEYDPYDLDEGEFGIFIVEKVNDKTAQRLMQHLKSGSSKRKVTDCDEDEYEEDVIKSHQCIHVMLFACVLYLKYVEKTENKPEIQIDKKRLKKALMPSFNWMLENKLKDDMTTIQKSNYKILGEWLQEYQKMKE